MKITEKRLRAARWLDGGGIEIGALHNPLLVPKRATVRYVDWLPLDTLRQHYPELAEEPLVPVDVLAQAEDLSPIDDHTQDFVVANHLLEHLENPIRALQEMGRVLRPGGILYVALPDPRVTWDRNRELTPVEHVLSEYANGTEATRQSHYADYVAHAEPLQGLPDGTMTGRERIQELMSRRYSIHFHVWDPAAFFAVVAAARAVAAVELELLEFSACRPGEDDEYIIIFASGAGELPLPASAATGGGGVDDASPAGVTRSPNGHRSHAADQATTLLLEQMATIRELRSEASSLTEDLREAAGTIAALRQEVEAARRDAAIMRWLRRNAGRVPFGSVLARRAARLILRKRSG